MGGSVPTSSLSPQKLAELKRRAEELIGRCRQQFLFRFPFTAAVMMRMDIVAVRDCRLRTASTDGSKIFVDVAFCDDLNQEELSFVLAHEVWHSILLHMLRGNGFERERFNIAADMEVNRLLAKEGIKVPRFALLPETGWNDKSAEEMYGLIKVSRRKNSERDKNEHTDKTTAGLEGQFDKHVVKEDNVENSAAANRRLAVWDKWGEVGYDRDYAPVVAVGVADSMREAVLSAAMQVGRTRGELPAHLKGIVNDLLAPKVDWREQLAQFVTSAFGGSRRWLPPSRRHIGRGLYLQSSRQERLRAVVAIDTSGSTMCDLPQFFAELRAILSSFGSYEVTVLQCDAEVESVEMYDETSDFDLRGVEFYGGGGTSFDPVFDYVDEHPELEPAVLIYLTDGYGTVREVPPQYPVMWILTGDGCIPAKWGTVAYLKAHNRGAE